MVVTEFKNLDGPLRQKEVESLQQYLLPKAKRSLGILCGRHAPSNQAIKARRRAWMEADKLILFLSDQDLIDLVRIKANGGDSSEVLDGKMDEFFVTLAP